MDKMRRIFEALNSPEARSDRSTNKYASMYSKILPMLPPLSLFTHYSLSFLSIMGIIAISCRFDSRLT